MIFCFYSFGGFSYWWDSMWYVGFLRSKAVVVTAVEKEEKQENLLWRLPVAGWSKFLTSLLLQQYSWDVSCGWGCYCHSQSSERNCASLELSLASVIHLILKGCCDKFFMCKGNMKLAEFQQTLVLSGACVVYIKLQNAFRASSPQQSCFNELECQL